MTDNIVFFDGECPFCHRSVRHLIEIDRNHKLMFAPLNGQTARTILSGPQEPLRHANSLVLAENYQSTQREFWVRSRAIFRVYWLIGNGWGLIGILCFLPGWFGDLLYRWFAAHRHQFKLKILEEPGPKNRFLP